VTTLLRNRAVNGPDARLPAQLANCLRTDNSKPKSVAVQRNADILDLISAFGIRNALWGTVIDPWGEPSRFGRGQRCRIVGDLCSQHASTQRRGRGEETGGSSESIESLCWIARQPIRQPVPAPRSPEAAHSSTAKHPHLRIISVETRCQLRRLALVRPPC
jgi:hypothetical protein